MGRLKLKIPGSTITETVVASVIFMLIFFICIESVTRVNSIRRSNVSAEIEIDFNRCVQAFSEDRCKHDEYTITYRWGEITVLVKPYREYADLTEMDFTARSDDGNGVLRYRILIQRGNEE